MNLLLPMLATAAFLAAGVGHSADDPATLACEEAVKQGLKAPKSYERAEAAIVNDTVYLTFDAVNEFNAPLRQSETCTFYLADGDMAAAMAPMGLKELVAKVKRFEEEAKGVTNAEQAKAIEEKGKALQLEVLSAQMKAVAIEMKLRKMPSLTYPIPLSQTQVKPGPKNF